MSDLRTFTLWAREKLTREAEDLLIQIYGLEGNGQFLPENKLPVLARTAEARETRARLEKLFADEEDAGVARAEAYGKLVKEVAFTHLNRLVALKLLEARKLIRGTVDRVHDSNGFKMYLAGQAEDLKLFEAGSMPQDDLGEGPSDCAYRHFLLSQYGELAREIKVLFDPDNLPSRLFPRSRVLRELIEALNADDRKPDWAAGNEETVGWVYQFFNAEEKAAAFDRVFKKKKKFEKSDLPAATQVFTPRWIVRFLVENSLGRLWMSMHPDSQLGDHLDYLTPLPEDPPRHALKPVREIRVLDPATGTMHFGLVAFDLLAHMYRDEIAHAGQQGWPAVPSVGHDEDIPAAILANNLFGIDIDLRAVQLAALALFLRAKAFNKNTALTGNNLACADVALFRGQHLSTITKEMALPPGITRDLFEKFRDSLEEASMMGSLVRLDRHFQNLESDRLLTAINAYVESKRAQGIDESYFANETSKGIRLLDVLSRKYDVVCTNPPYMAGRNMNPTMGEFMKRNYKKSKGDLYSAFIERCAELLDREGRVAMITQQSFMFISNFKPLRNLLLSSVAVEALAHLGPHAFQEVKGEKVNTAAFVLRREEFAQSRDRSKGLYFRLVKEQTAEAKKEAFEKSLSSYKASGLDVRVFVLAHDSLMSLPDLRFAYNAPPAIKALLCESNKIQDTASSVHGTATYDNFRFTRYWFEVGKAGVETGLTAWKEVVTRSGSLWVPVTKTGGQKWRDNELFVLSLRNGAAELSSFLETKNDSIRGAENMFRQGICTGLLSSKAFKARLKPSGYAFDVSAPTLFVEPWAPYLGLLNSSFAAFVLKVLNPTINFPPGDIGIIPVPRAGFGTKLAGLVEQVVALAYSRLAYDETSIHFVAPPDWPDGGLNTKARQRRSLGLEREIDEEVFRLFEIPIKDREVIEEELAVQTDSDDLEEDGQTDAEESEPQETPTLTTEEMAQEWLSYAVGLALGRFEVGQKDALGCGRFTAEVSGRLRAVTGSDGIMVIEEGHPYDLAQRVLDVLHVAHGDTETERIVRFGTGLQAPLRQSVAEYLLGAFFKRHVKRYRKRPVYWLLQSNDRNYGVYLFHERATDNSLSLLQGKNYLGGRLHRVETDLRHAKEKEATTTGGDKAGWAKKARELAEVLEDLRVFDQGITAANSFSITDRRGNPLTVRWQPEFDDGVLLNAAPLHELTPAWKRADAKLDLKKAWKDLENGEYDWAKTAMRYWPKRVWMACQENKSIAIAHGLA